MLKVSYSMLALAISSAIFSGDLVAEQASSGRIVQQDDVLLSAGNNVEDIEIIVVSATRTEKKLKDVSGSIAVIIAEDIEKQLVGDMSQLFKYDPSVQVTGAIGGAQNFVVRGMGGDRVLMIKDGMRMNEGYGANGLNDIVGRGFIETDTLKQVEVAKGAASSLYGSDALAGIVVFTTKDASDYLEEGQTFGGNVRIGGNSDGKQKNIGTTLALTTGNFEHVLSVTAREGEEQQNYHKTKPELAIDSQSYFYKGKYNINAQDYFTFNADYWLQQVNGKVANGLLGHFRNLDGYDITKESNNSERDNLSFQVRYHNETTTAFFDVLNMSLYSNSSKQKDIEYGQIDIDANFGYPLIELRDMWKTSVYQQDTLGFLSNASIKINNIHTLGYGLDVEKSTSLRTEVKLYEVEGAPKNGYPKSLEKFPETEVFRAGVFINDEMTFMEGSLVITPGIRFDRYEMKPKNTVKENGDSYKAYDESNVSFNIGALYKITDDLSLFAQYGQGFKVPAYDLAYIDHDNSLYGYKIVPASDDLSPEKSDSFEIGLRGHAGDFIFNGAVFYSQYDDFLSTVLIGTESMVNPYSGQQSDVLLYQYQNIDAVTIKGVEFGVNYLLGDYTTIFINASYQDGKDDTTGEYIQSISPLSGNLGVSYDSDDWSTEFIVRWAESMEKVNDGTTDVAGFAVVDWLVNYQLTNNVHINFMVNNVFDKEYVHYSNAAGHAENSRLDYLTETGREAAIMMRYSF